MRWRSIRAAICMSPTYAYAKGRDSITVYTPDGSQLVRTIPEELSGPISLGIGKE